MEAIGYADKDNTLPTSDVRRLWRAVDANEVKNKYNATIAEIPGLISAAVDALVTGAPGALDTLNELAAALGDDANFASTMATALSGKQATLVSGTNIKTVQGGSIVGSGDLVLISDGISNESMLAPTQNVVFDALAAVDTAIGLRLLKSDFVWGEIPSGTINGINTTFTIANADPTEIAVYADGQRINAAGFSVTGTTLEMASPPDNSLQIDCIK